MSFEVSNSARTYEWERFGLKLHSHGNSLPAGIEQMTVHIKASVAGQYEFPKNSYPVSAIFWIYCEPGCKLAKPILLEIQHCALSQNISKLSFVRASCTQKQLPYTFKRLAGGSFTATRSYGAIELNSFSGVGITQEGSPNRDYRALNLLKNPNSAEVFHFFFIVVWNTDAHSAVSHDLYIRQLILWSLSAFKTE